MSASKKLSNSVKALTFLASKHPDAQQSSEISLRVNINASKLRKLLSMLSKQGIVQSTKGSLGGFKLAKAAKNIHLQEIYCAIEDQKAFPLVTSDDGNTLTKPLDNYFNTLYCDIQEQIEFRMQGITLEDIINES